MKVRKPWLKVPPIAIAAAVLALALVCAEAASAGTRVGGVDVSGYPDVRVTVVAPAGALQPRLWENGNPVVGLRAANLGRAKSVVLAVDRSRSMHGKALGAATAAARAFVRDKRPADRLAVIAFGHRAVALSRFSASTIDSESVLRELVADTTTGTALWDSVVLAAQRLRHEDQPGHVIIVLTDGHDVSSVATFRDAVAAAHAARASVYPIAITGPDFTPDPLRELARDTGGSYHEASSTAKLAAVYAAIGTELARTWELRYLTAARPGDELRLRATVPGAGRAERTLTLPTLGSSPSAAAAPSRLVPASAYRSSAGTLVVAGIVAFLILLACAFWAAARQGVWVRSRLAPHLGQVKKDAKAARKRGRQALKGRLLSATEQVFANVKQFRALQQLLERADLPLRAAELLYISLGTAVVLGLFAALAAASPILILALMGIGAALPIVFVWFKAGKRLKTFDNQLPDLLITMAASLKAGHSFRQGIQSVVDEGAEPAAKEFKRVLNETRLGRPMDDALGDMATRVGSKNLQFVLTAVTIQRQIGGSLAGLFDMVAETVRQRQQFARKIRGLTAMGRMSAYVLVGLPFFIAIAITVMNPKYMAPLYHTSTGHMLIAVGLAMMTLGSLILKKMVSFRG